MRNPNIKYINSKCPDFELPVYHGERYEAMVPDTLDIQEMSAMGVNGLTEPTDPEADYEIYWRLTLNTNPPMMLHAESDIVQAKFMEALPLLRLVSGSKQNFHVEHRWMEVIRQMQGPDGLLYLPKKGRPWCIFESYGNEPPGDHYFSPWMEGRLLGAMTIYFLLTGDPEWKERGKRVVDGLNKLAVHEGKKAHFPCHEFGTEGRYNPPKDPAQAVHNPATYHSWAIQGLANYARHTGYKPALDLAGNLSRFVMEDSKHFDASGRFLEEYPGVKRIHFHGHTMVLLSLLDYGTVAGDREAVDFAHRGFRYGMTQGECLLGFFPEWLNMDEPQTLEICELADMISLAIKLSLAGVGDYWDMADRWIRNLFLEGQLRRADWVYWVGNKTAISVAPFHLPAYHTNERVAERNIGAFGSEMAPNDFLPEFPHDCRSQTSSLIHCCTGNATRTIYYAWENILTHENGRLRINLLLNRASDWADVDSRIPYEGQVNVKVKQPVDLSVRIPEWVKPNETKCKVNDKNHDVRFNGRYAQMGKVQADDIITLTFPISERSDWINIEKRTYRILRRGNTCVAIDPPGINCPLFQREYYRENITRWKKVSRFVTDKSIEW